MSLILELSTLQTAAAVWPFAVPVCISAQACNLLVIAGGICTLLPLLRHLQRGLHVIICNSPASLLLLLQMTMCSPQTPVP